MVLTHFYSIYETFLGINVQNFTWHSNHSKYEKRRVAKKWFEQHKIKPFQRSNGVRIGVHKHILSLHDGRFL